MITTDKRYQVFVSSTYDDLQDERKEVMQALLELDCIPAGMELFPASSEDQWSLIKRVIDDCDYYILIIGGRMEVLVLMGLATLKWNLNMLLKQGSPSFHLYIKIQHPYQLEKASRLTREKRN